ncbi:MAG: glycosyltransferase family 4 protein [Thermodesulfovibrionia bacterium]
MKILHTETLKKWGGQQNRVLMECIGLRRRGHEMIIACHKGSVLAERAKAEGIKVYEVNMVKQAHLVTIPRLIKIIKEENVDVVSTHSSVDSWAGGIAARMTGRRLVRFRHNLYPIGKDPLTRFIYGLPHSFIAISNAVKDILVDCGINRERINIIHSCVDFSRFNPDIKDLKEELGIPTNSMMIGNTSTFTGVKGQEFLLKAFNKIYREFPCLMLFAGRISIESKKRYLSYVNEELRDKIIFLGHRDDIPRILKTIDIFVYPSFSEGLGTALLEAMAMERPVVVSDIPTFREFIVDGENGLFFRAGDSHDMAEKVLFLIHNKELRERLGRNARRTVLERFTFDEMIDKTEILYRQVLNAK